jgi:DNA primase
LRAGMKNVIAMNGTKLPDSIKELSKEKDITLFVDGDRGGKLIIQNVVDNARVKYIVVAPDGKEVEELTGKEILMCLRKKIPLQEFLSRSGYLKRSFEKPEKEEKKTEGLNDNSRKKLKEISEKNKGTGKAILLDNSLQEIKSVPARSLATTLKKMRKKPSFVIIDGIATVPTIKTAEESGVQALAAKNFTTTNTKIELLSF